MMDATCIDHSAVVASGTCLRCGGFLCEPCGAVGRCVACLAREPGPEAQPRSIGGWLILPLLSLFSYPLLFVARVIPVFIQVRKAGGLEAVFVADPGWLALSMYDLVASAGIGGWALFTLPGFLKKQRATVWRMQALYAALMLNNLVAYVMERLQADASASSTLPIFQLAIPLLWIQYFNTSKRVKETFVR